MLVAIEGEVLSDEFVDDEILIGEIGAIGRRIVEGTKDLSADPGSDLGQDSPFL